jgi:hypothetical protein
MSEAFVFICTKQTAPVHVPAFAATENDHRRNVNNAFSAISGGFRTVGQLAFFPLSSAVPDHLLCDGSTLEVASFPQLAAYLGATETTFDLPNYLTGLTFASTAPVQTVSDGGTVSTGGTVTTPTDPGQTGGTTGGNVSSGGRPRNPDERVP